MRVTWLADVLRAAKLEVIECPGWRGRGKPLVSVQGVVLHHTATPPSASDDGVVRLLRDGRADLPGPLCQLGLDRSGRWHLIADGKGNHNGSGQWGNQAIGVEAFNNGVGEPWAPAQVDSYQRGVAAILRHLGLPIERVLGHRETDPGRKSDPRGIDLVAFRKRLAALMEDDFTMDDEAKQAFAAMDGRLDVITDAVSKIAGEVAILRSAVKGVADDANGMSWLGERVAEIKADLKEVKQAHGIED